MCVSQFQNVKYYTVTQITDKSSDIREEDLLLILLIKELEPLKRTLRNIFNNSFFKRYDTFRRSIKRLESAGYINKLKKLSRCRIINITHLDFLDKGVMIQIPEYLIRLCKIGVITFQEMLQLARIEQFKDKGYSELKRDYASNITGRSKTGTRSKAAVYITLKGLRKKGFVEGEKGAIKLTQFYWEMCQNMGGN